MKKNFMTRALSVVLSAAMALSLSVVANVASADAAAAKPAFKKATKTIAADKKQVKFYTTKKTKKNFTLTKVKTASADVTVSANKAKQVITVKRAAAELAADASATIKCTFKNKKTTKKVTKSVKVNVKANKVEEQVVEAFAVDITAVSKNTFKVTFNKAVSDEVAVTLEKVDTDVASKVDADVKVAEDKLSATLTLKANIQKGTYKVTVKDGENEASKEIATTDEAATQIKITSTVALTNSATTGVIAGHYAYIYYDVLDQYGESVRNSASIKWSTSSGEPDEDVSKGKLTVECGKDASKDAFMYGQDIVVVGVDANAGLTVQETVKVGMAQKLDTVKFAGFIDLKDQTKLLDTLPADFAKDRYVLAYQAMDQDGHELELTKEMQEKDVTFICDNPTLIDAQTFKFNATDNDKTPAVKIEKKTYYTIAVNPGMYSAKGGEVNITAISNNTGAKSNVNYVIGGTPLLKMFKIGQPETLRAGDKEVNIPFTATDVNGNELHNYESIVRSTNALSLGCTRGTLLLTENNDGTAKLTWSDRVGYTNDDGDRWYNADINIMNKAGQMTVFTSLVIGGEADNKILNIGEARMPSNITKVTVPGTIIAGDSVVTMLNKDSDDDTKIWFADQDGKDLDKGVAAIFFDQASKDAVGDRAFKDEYKYAVKVTYGASGKKYVDNAKTTVDTPAKSTEYTYSIVRTKSDKPYIAADPKDAVADKDVKTVGDEFTKKVNVITLEDAEQKGIKIKAIGKQRIITNATEYATLTDAVVDNASINGITNPAAMNLKNTVTSGTAIDIAVVKDENKVAIVAGADISVPVSMFETAADSDLNMEDGRVASITAGALKWADIYNSTDKGTRKEATKTLKIKAISSDLVLSTSVKLSDEKRKVASVELLPDYKLIGGSGADLTIKPSYTEFAFSQLYDPWYSATGPWVAVKDQYGIGYEKGTHEPDWTNWVRTADANLPKVTFTISDLKESDSELTHVPGNLKFKDNGTDHASVVGAEVGDTFKVTLSCDGVSATYNITVSADAAANIGGMDGITITTDKVFRTGKLGSGVDYTFADGSKYDGLGYAN